MGFVLNHRHDWAATADGYACLTCSAQLSNSEIKANPTPTGVSPAEYCGRKLHK